MSYTNDALLSAIHDLSEDLWTTGWSYDLEFTLWSALLGDKRWPRATEVPLDAIGHIAYLSSQCDGWWVHCDTVGREWQECGGRVFLPLDEWRTLYSSRIPGGSK